MGDKCLVMFCGVVLYAISSLAIISLKRRDGCFTLLVSCCGMCVFVCVLDLCFNNSRMNFLVSFLVLQSSC